MAAYTKHINAAYTKNGNNLQQPAKQSGGTCYAHASATAIRATESRIIGRKLTPYQSLVKEITNKHGCKGGRVSVVLSEQCPKRRLKYGEVSANGAKEALGKDRAVIMAFYLDDDQWDRFSSFYKKTPKGVLSSKNIGMTTGKLSGHAVCIFGYGADYWKIKNSWGAAFADDGYFRVKFNAMANVRYYDVYFRVCDLSQQDKENFANNQ
mmetsp:Transcript_59307/g.53423  ORF Transcript_59307/g.53423 Transcript_59307/m.53423 type:complete len:209 (-) Transcript_59307:97-723(-)